MNKKEEFQYHVTKFLTSYCAGQRNLSSNTIASYVFTCRLLLMWFGEVKGIRPDRVTLDDITRENIVEFLDWLEEEREVTESTRNVRLAAIHSFVRYVQIEDPAHLHEYQKILAIKRKKHQSNEVPYLTVDQVKAILSAPESSTKQGFRDKVLLTVLYDTGARVSELIHMKVEDIRLEKPATVKICGKGNKTRTVPLMGNTVELLKQYIEQNDLNKKHSRQECLFVNRSRRSLTEPGIAYIIDKYVALANNRGANITINVHPHVFRHTKAIHLLESGVELIYIRDILGHSSVTTTEIYAKVCSANKRAALEKAYEDVADVNEEDWTDDKDLMAFLFDITKKK